MGFYSKYRGRSVGRVLGALEAYCGLTHWVESCQIGDGKVTFAGKTVATYEWIGADIPRFTFLGEYAHFQKHADLRERFLDEIDTMPQRPECIVQEIKVALTLWEALQIRHVRDTELGMSFLQREIVEKIQQTISAVNWDRVAPSWIAQHWEFFMWQAIAEI